MPLQRPSQLSDFERPLDVLRACHEDIAARLALLQAVAERLPLQGCDAGCQQAASSVMRFFDGAARHHHEDEECDLLSRMREAAVGENAERVALLGEGISREHAEMEWEWARLREQLESLAYGMITRLDGAAIQRYCATYAMHMRREEDHFFPLAAVLLSPEALSAVGLSMARRRGIAS